MRNLKTIENRVLAVLKEHPEARNDDMKLYLLVSKACIYDTHGISHFSFEDVMSNYKAYGIPCFESIRRTRQKIQAKYPDINDSNVMDILKEEIGQVFVGVLEDAGVYKCTEEGRAAFDRFIAVL